MPPSLLLPPLRSPLRSLPVLRLLGCSSVICNRWHAIGSDSSAAWSHGSSTTVDSYSLAVSESVGRFGLFISKISFKSKSNFFATIRGVSLSCAKYTISLHPKRWLTRTPFPPGGSTDGCAGSLDGVAPAPLLLLLFGGRPRRLLPAPAGPLPPVPRDGPPSFSLPDARSLLGLPGLALGTHDVFLGSPCCHGVSPGERRVESGGQSGVEEGWVGWGRWRRHD